MLGLTKISVHTENRHYGRGECFADLLASCHSLQSFELRHKHLPLSFVSSAHHFHCLRQSHRTLTKLHLDGIEVSGPDRLLPILVVCTELVSLRMIQIWFSEKGNWRHEERLAFAEALGNMASLENLEVSGDNWDLDESTLSKIASGISGSILRLRLGPRLCDDREEGAKESAVSAFFLRAVAHHCTLLQKLIVCVSDISDEELLELVGSCSSLLWMEAHWRPLSLATIREVVRRGRSKGNLRCFGCIPGDDAPTEWRILPGSSCPAPNKWVRDLIIDTSGEFIYNHLCGGTPYRFTFEKSLSGQLNERQESTARSLWKNGLCGSSHWKEHCVPEDVPEGCNDERVHIPYEGPEVL